MLDFLMITHSTNKKGETDIFPIFKVTNVKDLMVKGGRFYAIYDESTGLWTKDEGIASSLIDKDLALYYERLREKNPELENIKVKYLWNSKSGSVDEWHKYVQKQLWDQYHNLDENIIFSNNKTTREDYASIKLQYPLEEGPIDNYDELMNALYDPEERVKLEWSIGAIISGDSKDIQKFVVLYGSAGSGKSTFLNIVQKLFEGYYCTFDAKQLGSNNNQFAMESFKNNPLIGIQHDGDLSRIEDNTKLNSIVSHEYMEINEKFKTLYATRLNTFLFMGTNKPVKITEAKSGLLRRLIDVNPSGRKIPFERYVVLMNGIDFELGAIAKHCLDLYKALGRSYYDGYIPKNMMSATNDFYDFVENHYDEFKKVDIIQLKDAWEMYKKYCEYAKVAYPYSMRAVRTELQNYFDEYKEDVYEDGKHYRNVYRGFRTDKFFYEKMEPDNKKQPEDMKWLFFNSSTSIFDEECSKCLAQYANDQEKPFMKWSEVVTNLEDLDTTKIHYVMIPTNHIVIDFDLKDENGNKSIDLNLEAANKWPKTYAEISKGGNGIHLHYIYQGDVEQLSRIYDTGIEIKVFTGNSSLRRKLTKCNDIPIATISSGLPLKGGKNVVNFEGVKNEKAIRTLIKNNLNKKYVEATKPSVDFIFNTLEEAYNSGIEYDVRDLRPDVLKFAANSTNQSSYCITKVSKMHFCSENVNEGDTTVDSEADIVFFDVEVFPNLFVVVWKKQGGVPVKMINPGATDVNALTNFRLVGFNNRKYDNHILYARILGYDNQQLFELSNKIINGSRNSAFGNAYNMSYTDVFDFAAKKQGLKKWEIELGITHKELGLRWDEPVPEEQWQLVADYCANDVIATEAVFNKLQSDFLAREILADVSGLSVNDTTNNHTTRIIFGKEKHPKLEYVDLSETFPGYEFVNGQNMYRGTNVGRGGYIMSNPGIYSDVAMLDIASLHPNSIINMNLFGEYTKRFKELVDARIAIKHGDYESAKKMLDGKLVPYLSDKSTAKDLSYALKIAINSVYGLTAASFDNPFKDDRNKNNVVALRGALFMRTLQDEVEKRGFKIVAIKTDSIKIANATKKIVEYCMEFANKYGYSFEHEATYDRICQINDADYVARYWDEHWCETEYGYVPDDVKDHPKGWTVTGKRFAHPYIFKNLFSRENIVFEDMCETKSVTTAMYLDMNEKLKEDEHDLVFVGKVGQFCPIAPGKNGGILYREKDGKYDSVAGTKGYRWLESETVKHLKKEKDIDKEYFRKLVDDAITEIEKYGSYEFFVSDEFYDEQLPF